MNLINKIKNGFSHIEEFFHKEEFWWEEYDKSWIEKVHDKFRDFISYLIFDRGWTWLEFLISLLCDIEMQLPLIFDEEFRHDLNRADTRMIHPVEEETTYADREIPKNTFYCEDCIFCERSKVADFFYGSQSTGYCYYLGKGDFSFIRPTQILWDGCKECGKFEDIEIDEEEYWENGKKMIEEIQAEKLENNA